MMPATTEDIGVNILRWNIIALMIDYEKEEPKPYIKRFNKIFQSEVSNEYKVLRRIFLP